MDKASDYESGDSRFDSWQGRLIEGVIVVRFPNRQFTKASRPVCFVHCYAYLEYVKLLLQPPCHYCCGLTDVKYVRFFILRNELLAYVI